MYQECFDLIVEHIYGGVALDTYQTLVCTQLATFMSILTVALPFCACLGIVKEIFK